MSTKLVRLASNEMYKLLNNCLGEVMYLKNHISDGDKYSLHGKLSLVEESINEAMKWADGIKEL